MTTHFKTGRKRFAGILAAVAWNLAILLLCSARASALGKENAELIQQSCAVGNLKVEFRANPVGLDRGAPRFSWELWGERRGLRQAAYRVLVADSREDLDAERASVWDSGRVESSSSHLVPYSGKPLRSNHSYFWKVRVWDEAGQASQWSEPAFWTSGLLDSAQEWQAEWIGYDAPAPGALDSGSAFQIQAAQWIWTSEGGKPKKGAVGYFWKTLQLKRASVRRAIIGVTADFSLQLFINGREVFQGGRRKLQYLDLTQWLQDGQNTVGARVLHCGPGDAPGLLASLRIEKVDGTVEFVPTDATWQGSAGPVDFWNAAECKSRAWEPVKAVPFSTGEKVATEKCWMPPATYVRKEFHPKMPVRSAILHASAQGLFDVYFNGKILGEERFKPGWTNYAMRRNYVTYDLTGQIRNGANALGAVVGDGWFRGNIAWFGRERFGNATRFAAQLHLLYEDGSTEVLKTGSDWKAAFGPIQQTDNLMGEVYDARLEMPGWSAPGFDDAQWQPVAVGLSAPPSGPSQKEQKPVFVMQSAPMEMIRPMQEFKPVKITEPRPGVFVFDFGQNFAGWARLRVQGKSGDSVNIRFAEVLKPDGTIYTDNLRSVNPADTYFLKGGGVETWEPRFTYHGFRFAQVVGLAGKPDMQTLTGIAAHSAGPITSTFETSSDLLNQLYRNISWAQRSNYFEAPTDCPQRDERLGWVGDAHFFIKSATYNQDGGPFFEKWLQDLMDVQLLSPADPRDGDISNLAPATLSTTRGGACHMDWSAAMMIAPYQVWQVYGDDQRLREIYPRLQRYMGFVERTIADMDAGKDGPKDLGGNFVGDWCTVGPQTPKTVIGRAYAVYLADMMAEVARVCGQPNDAEHYRAFAAQTRERFVEKSVSSEGKVEGETQAGYALALRFGLVPPEKRQKVLGRFEELLKKDGYHIKTGFIGTGHLLPALTLMGRSDLAYRIIQTRSYPSWGFMIDNGATSIWEHWDGFKPPGEFFNAYMNSFNHYTFGSCGEWMFRSVLGIETAEPGFKKLHMEPEIAGELTFAKGSFHSVYGPVTAGWERKEDITSYSVGIPPNTTAEILLPVSDPGQVRESGKPISQTQGVRMGERSPGKTLLQVESGHYHFEWAGNAR